MSLAITIEQIRAGRALKGWGQAELAERSGFSQVTIANIESGKSRGSKESLTAIALSLQNAGIEFLPNGVRITSNSISTIDGKDSFVQLLDDVLFSLREEDEKQVLLFGSDERRSSREVNQRLRKLRQAGIKFRSLIAPGNDYLLGTLDEYRKLPSELVSTDVIVIYARKVAFILEGKPQPRVLLVQNDLINMDHRRIFNYFWDVGKQPLKTTAKERYDTI